MNKGVIVVQLERDGPPTAWGFRLQGGVDIGIPLSIQRVCLGTPSEGELRRGDIVLQIGDRDATRVTHQEAHDLIKHAGNHLTLVIQRLQTGGAQPTTPSTALAYTGGHPLSPLSLPTTPAAAMNRTYSPVYQTLPTTNHPGKFRPYVPDPEGFVAAELQEYSEEKQREKNAIVHQTYRTTPLIMPQAKTKHDMPMGSYLRHVHDPNWNGPPHPGATPVSNATVMRKIQEASQACATRSVPTFAATNPSRPDEPVNVLLKQYNSPINMYSPQSVAETLNAQTGLQPPSKLSPRQPGTRQSVNQPIKQNPQPYQVADITQSPTYRLIHDEEWKDLRKSELREQAPPQFRVYDVPTGAEAPVNALGVPKGKIIQSGSFNTIKNTLLLSQVQSDY